MRPTYIGITDFDSRARTFEFLGKFLAARNPGSTRMLMVGVMMSYKTLNDIPSKWASVWPKKENVADIFFPDPNLMNTLHYADYDGETTRDDITNALRLAGSDIDAFQFDMIWPAPALCEEVKDSLNDVSTILQLNKRAMEVVSNSPSELVLRLREYRELIDYALLDMSMGRGKPMDPVALSITANAILSSSVFEVSVAGGLGPDTLHLLDELQPLFPRLSIDAQGQLRRSGNSLDPIEWDRAELYMTRALAKLEP